jgi:hypothetical protein
VDGGADTQRSVHVVHFIAEQVPAPQLACEFAPDFLGFGFTAGTAGVPGVVTVAETPTAGVVTVTLGGVGIAGVVTVAETVGAWTAAVPVPVTVTAVGTAGVVTVTDAGASVVIVAEAAGGVIEPDAPHAERSAAAPTAVRERTR